MRNNTIDLYSISYLGSSYSFKNVNSKLNLL